MFVEGKMVRAPRPWHESKELKLMRDDSQEIEIEQDDLETRVSLPERPRFWLQRTIPRSRSFPSSRRGVGGPFLKNTNVDET
jgi:hypothetical protein